MDLTSRITEFLRFLVSEIGPRPPGSPANRRATAWAAAVLESSGWTVRADPFTTRWWQPGRGLLTVGDRTIERIPNPFSPPCDVVGTIVRIGTLDALETLATSATRDDTVLCLEESVGGDMVMPAAFPFFQPDEHVRLNRALVRARPAAVIAMSRLAASLPTFEDPDLGIPSLTVTPDVGALLADGTEVGVRIEGAVHDGEGHNLSARPAGVDAATSRIVLSAHVDAKITTPGAVDNAGSVATLLALADAGWPDGAPPVEVVLFNGEDHFDACGEQAWLAATDLTTIRAAVNLDGAGAAGRATTVTSLAAPAPLERALADLVAARPGWKPTEPWVQSDHAIFAARGIPAVAITCDDAQDLFDHVVHTPADTLEGVDVAVLADIGAALPALVREIDAALTRATHGSA